MDENFDRAAAMHVYPASEDLASDPRSRSWDTQRPNRGRCRVACQGKSLRERQAIGARNVAARRRDTSVQALTEAYTRLIAAGRMMVGKVPTATTLAAEAGTCTRTIARHRSTVLTQVANKLGDHIQPRARPQLSPRNGKAQQEAPFSTGRRRVAR